MIKLDIIPIELKDTERHIATDWAVYDKEYVDDTSTPILTSYVDTKNLYSINFDVDTDSNKTYYARARFLLNTGYTHWGDTKILKYVKDDSLVNDKFPTRVAIPYIRTYRMKTIAGIGDENITLNAPTITGQSITGEVNLIAYAELYTNTTSSTMLLELIDPNYHDLTLFYIKAMGYSCIGSASHIATSWWIEDTLGRVIYAVKKSTTFKDYIVVDTLMLKPNRVYTIKAMFHTDTNDSSQVGSYTISTVNGQSLSLSTNFNQVIPENDYDFNLVTTDTTIESYDVEVYAYKQNNLELIWSLNTTSTLITIPKGILETNTNYLFRAKPNNLTESWYYSKFSTTLNNGKTIDDEIRYIFVTPSAVEGYPGTSYKLNITTYGYNNLTYEVEKGTRLDGTTYDIATFNKTTNSITLVEQGSTKLLIKSTTGEIVKEVTINVLAIENTKYLNVNSSITTNVNTNNEIPIYTNYDLVTITSIDNNTNYTYKLADDNSSLYIVFKKEGTYNLLISGYDIIGGYDSVSKKVEVVVEAAKQTNYTIDIPSEVTVEIGNTIPIEYFTNYPKIIAKSPSGVCKVLVGQDTLTSLGTINVTPINYIYDDTTSSFIPDTILVECYDMNDTLHLTKQIKVNITGVTKGTTKLSITNLTKNNDGTYETKLKWHGKLTVQLDTNITKVDDYTVTGYEGTSLVLDKQAGYFTLSVPNNDTSLIGQEVSLTIYGTKTDSSNVVYSKSDNVIVNITYSDLDIVGNDIVKELNDATYTYNNVSYNSTTGKAVYTYPTSVGLTFMAYSIIPESSLGIKVTNSSNAIVTHTLTKTSSEIYDGESYNIYKVSIPSSSAIPDTYKVTLRPTYDNYTYSDKIATIIPIVDDVSIMVSNSNSVYEDNVFSIILTSDAPSKTIYYFGNYDNIVTSTANNDDVFDIDMVDNSITVTRGTNYTTSDAKITLTATLNGKTITKEIHVVNEITEKEITIELNKRTTTVTDFWFEDVVFTGSTNAESLDDITIDVVNTDLDPYCRIDITGTPEAFTLTISFASGINSGKTLELNLTTHYRDTADINYVNLDVTKYIYYNDIPAIDNEVSLVGGGSSTEANPTLTYNYKLESRYVTITGPDILASGNTEKNLVTYESQNLRFGTIHSDSQYVSISNTATTEHTIANNYTATLVSTTPYTVTKTVRYTLLDAIDTTEQTEEVTVSYYKWNVLLNVDDEILNNTFNLTIQAFAGMIDNMPYRTYKKVIVKPNIPFVTSLDGGTIYRSTTAKRIPANTATNVSIPFLIDGEKPEAIGLGDAATNTYVDVPLTVTSGFGASGTINGTPYTIRLQNTTIDVVNGRFNIDITLTATHEYMLGFRFSKNNMNIMRYFKVIAV
jgi:hypothetical protein